MKILLAYPYFQQDRAEDENVVAIPIGVYYVAATLVEAGHDVTVANWHGLRDKPEVMEKELREIAPDILGVTVFTANRWGAVQAARMAKKVNPKTTVVFGGIGATFLAHFFLDRFQVVDCVLRGEGELAFPALLQAIKDGTSLAHVPNLSWRDGKQVCDNPCAPFVSDLDSLPDPAKYFTFKHVILSRGCPGKCIFCGSPRFWEGRVRFHSPAYLVRQIERLSSRGIRFFYVSDDTFTLRREMVLEFCRLLQERGLKVQWQAISRVDRVDEETLAAMRAAGCVQISYGVESGSPEIRKTLRKNTTDKQIRRAFDLTTRYGMVARAYIIYGNPGECEATIEQSRRFLHSIRPLVALFHVLTVLPGTELYDRACREFGVTDDVWNMDEEDLLWFDLDPALEFKQVHDWGTRLKRAQHEALPEYVEQLEVAEEPRLYPAFADFFSRLGMTFDQGDYAENYPQGTRDHLAERLFRRALQYGADPKASLGLGMLLHRHGHHSEAVSELEEGLRQFPNEPNLRLCLGIALMNVGRFKAALSHLEKLRAFPQAQPYIQQCREAVTHH
ncbi:Radical SAM superfamily enzyme YgiQ, UPF0313 family [Paucidesulfovibrio gracilis DSM 16080]|uniref:Radical SAM superfamily enzyme YgiQ, UPF0313 family n=1 Tax=Paucidesulfovibrio gracilis DSM 16080 TaxID=1121449 RepID=A0A1T4WLT7_9BACT|nr:radical SAM protein [Paucidesulfovibrio gracilis]SKA78117.1 Radical SAM superfamily enzyme YgiQ, UPF0313 family [Paucidesulfovibrio gracilis DSM 16080]